MLDYDTFLSELYVSIDDFCKSRPTLLEALLDAPGEPTALFPSEVATLVLFAQWARFRSERDFYRFAQQRLRTLFPRLPARAQFNRAERRYAPLIVAFFQHLARRLGARESAYEILDRFGVATRHLGRRGYEWLAGYAQVGYCTRLGFFHGLQVLTALTPEGVLTGLGVGSGNSKDQPMAESFLALRHTPDSRFASVGVPAGSQTYVADKGFSGPKLHQRWRESYGAELICAPQRRHGPSWPKALRRWVATLRQVIESVHEKLLECFRLERERPHTMSGFFVRLCAKAGLHNFCIGLNRRLGRPDLAFADLLDW